MALAVAAAAPGTCEIALSHQIALGHDCHRELRTGAIAIGGLGLLPTRIRQVRAGDGVAGLRCFAIPKIRGIGIGRHT